MTPTIEAFVFCLFIGGPAFGFWAAFRAIGSKVGMTMAFFFGAFAAYSGWLVSGLVAKTGFPYYPAFGGPPEPIALLFVLPGFVTGGFGLWILARVQRNYGYAPLTPEEGETQRRRFVTRFALVTALGLVLGLLAVLAAGVLVPFGGMQSTMVKTDRPLSVQDAATLCPIPLPDGAFNVQCADWGVWMALVRVVKFQAPVDVCKAHAVRLITEHNRVNPGAPVPTGLVVLQAPPDPVALPAEMQVNWFDVNNILSGFVVGRRGSHIPCIWIDDQRGVFYYLLTD